MMRFLTALATCAVLAGCTDKLDDGPTILGFTPELRTEMRAAISKNDPKADADQVVADYMDRVRQAAEKSDIKPNAAGDYLYPAEQLGKLSQQYNLVRRGDVDIAMVLHGTPSGRFPIKGTVWTMTDMSRTEQATPVWAIITALLVFWWTCLLGLLFLLVKETKTTGHIQVTVQGGGHYHATQIMVSNAAYAQHIAQQVNYARSLAA